MYPEATEERPAMAMVVLGVSARRTLTRHDLRGQPRNRIVFGSTIPCLRDQIDEVEKLYLNGGTMESNTVQFGTLRCPLRAKVARDGIDNKVMLRFNFRKERPASVAQKISVCRWIRYHRLTRPCSRWWIHRILLRTKFVLS